MSNAFLTNIKMEVEQLYRAMDMVVALMQLRSEYTSQLKKEIANSYILGVAEYINTVEQYFNIEFDQSSYIRDEDIIQMYKQIFRTQIDNEAIVADVYDSDSGSESESDSEPEYVEYIDLTGGYSKKAAYVRLLLAKNAKNKKFDIRKIKSPSKSIIEKYSKK